MPSLQELAVGVLKRMGGAQDIPKTDYYTNVTAKVPQNKAWAPNLPDLVLGQPTTPAASDLSKYPKIASAWSSVTGQYPGAAGSRVSPMSLLQRVQGKAYGYLTGNPSESVTAISEGNDIRFNPALESKTPDEIRSTLLHESVHGAQRRTFPTQSGSDRAYFRPGQYWTSPGEAQAYEVERQDQLKRMAAQRR